jgi:hypothetical protein
MYLLCPHLARERAASAVDSPTADEQIDAVLSAVEREGGTSAEQQQHLEAIASEVEERVLAQRVLGEAARAARDAELCDMVYSQ